MRLTRTRKTFFCSGILFSILFFPNRGFAVAFMSGEYSLGNYYSKSVERMNDRLGNSPALEVPTQFGRTSGVGVDLFYSDRARKKVFQIAYFGFQESISAKSSTTEDKMSASFQAHQLVIGFGTQLWPLTATAKRTDAAPSKDNSAGRGGGSTFRKKTYVLGLVGAGMFWGIHNYQLSVPGDGVDIKYKTLATHLTYGVTIRGSYLLFPGFEFISDLAFFTTQKKSSKQTIDTFTVGQQDLRYKPELADLDSLTNSPVHVLRLAFGISFNLSPN